MNHKLKELRDKLEALCDEYRDTHAILVMIVEDESHEFALSGNMCPVCAVEDLTNVIIQNNIQHAIADKKVH